MTTDKPGGKAASSRGPAVSAGTSPHPVAAAASDDGRKASAGTLYAAAAYWRTAGYDAEVRPAKGYVTVALSPDTELHDAGTRLRLVAGLSDDALREVSLRARTWGGPVMIYGPWPGEAAGRFYVACRRLGVDVDGCGPSPEAVAVVGREAGRREAAKADAAKARALKAYVLDGDAGNATPAMIAYADADPGAAGRVLGLYGADAALFARRAEAEGARIIAGNPDAAKPRPAAGPEPASAPADRQQSVGGGTP